MEKKLEINGRMFTVTLTKIGEDSAERYRERVTEQFEGVNVVHWDCDFPARYVSEYAEGYFQDFCASFAWKIETFGAIFCGAMGAEVNDNRPFFITRRDPKMNTAFEGKLQVSEPYAFGEYSQEDAMGSVWCIVGDDIRELIGILVDDHCDHFEGEAA